jgi:hypothetical protein
MDTPPADPNAPPERQRQPRARAPPRLVGRDDLWLRGAPAANGIPFDAGVAFNVADLGCATVHKTTLANIVGADTLLSGPTAPRTVVLATNLVAAGALPAANDPMQLAARYEGGRWRLHSWSNWVESMVPGAQMNVLVQAPVP